jgi:cytochrome c biogenesis protein CcdA
MNAAIAFAASAGVLAAFNPCGFALLPGYLAMFVGGGGSTERTVGRALVVAAAVTAGFVAVFGAVGIAVSALSLSLGPWLSVVTMAAGVALLAVGVVQLVGRDVSLRVPRARLAVDRSVLGMAGYGVIYATVSLSCTLPVFLAAVVSASAAPGSSAWTTTVAALAYAAGMGLVMATLALVVGLLGRGALGRARTWTRYVGRVSGLVVVLGALYVLWYGWVELQSYAGRPVPAGPVTWVGTASAWVSQRITDAGTGRTLAILTAVLAIAGASALSRRRRAR